MPYAQPHFSPLVEKQVTLGNIILIQQSTKPPRIGEEVFEKFLPDHRNSIRKALCVICKVLFSFS